MDKLSHLSPRIPTTPLLEQLPEEVLQRVLHYLPIKGARNVFRLLSKRYLASTDYLRIAGLAHARIASRAMGETQAQASTRFAGLINDCMDQRLPVATTISLVMKLVDLLPALPPGAHPAAMRAVLASSKLLGEKAGIEIREKCMARCIHAYQRRSEMDEQVPKFEPMDDEEAALAARHFSTDLDPAIISAQQVLNHLENLHAAMAWAAREVDVDKRGRLLGQMCAHAVATFASFNQIGGELVFGKHGQRSSALRTNLAQAAMQLFPLQTTAAQAALISLALEASANDKAAYQRAVAAGRRLIRQMPDSALQDNWVAVAKALFRVGLVKALIKRASAWPEPLARASLLGQLASAAFAAGALDEMHRLCATINVLVPPRTAALYTLILKNADTCGSARVEVIVRELIPPLMAMPASLEKFVLIAAASAFIFAPVPHEPGISSEFRIGMLLRLCFESYKQLIDATFRMPVAGGNPMRRQLLALADALMEQAEAIPFEFNARASMKSALLELLSPLAEKILQDDRIAFAGTSNTNPKL